MAVVFFMFGVGLSYLFAPQGHWVWRRREVGVVPLWKDSIITLLWVLQNLLKRLYGKRSCK